MGKISNLEFPWFSFRNQRLNVRPVWLCSCNLFLVRFGAQAMLTGRLGGRDRFEF
jgi:hypothetical protein